MPKGIANAVQAFPDGRSINSGGRRRDTCHRGHARVPDNLYASGGCKLCQRDRLRFYHQQQREARRLARMAGEAMAR